MIQDSSRLSDRKEDGLGSSTNRFTKSINLIQTVGPLVFPEHFCPLNWTFESPGTFRGDVKFNCGIGPLGRPTNVTVNPFLGLQTITLLLF